QRDTVAIIENDDALIIDVHELEKAYASDNPEEWEQSISLCKGRFLEGFSLRDSLAFDDWQTSTAQYYDDLMQQMMARLATHHTQAKHYDDAIKFWRQLYTMNPLHEGAVTALMQIYRKMGLDHAANKIYQDYASQLDKEIAISPSIAVQTIHEQIIDNKQSPYHLPIAPQALIGRETLIQTLVAQLQTSGQRLILQGWPGIGKTSLIAHLSHHATLQTHFKDGILWASLGEAPDLMRILQDWATAIGLSLQQSSVEQMRQQLQIALQDKTLLLIIDDVWQSEHVQSLLLANSTSSTLLTTRFNDIAHQVMLHPDNIIKVPILTTQQSLSLLQTLAPQVVQHYPQQCEQLVTSIEGLPLALQVVGRLLYEESQLGWDVTSLLDELCETNTLLSAQAPVDRMDIASQTTPTIAAILQRSVQQLSQSLQERFTLLGVFAPKPATFTVDAIQAVWDSDDIRNDVRQLVNRGLLEPIQDQRFQMHALIAMLARSMVEGDYDA
ncbi:MAG: NB-ARC domain-containing protein, partial [Chloroflexota bacterium]